MPSWFDAHLQKKLVDYRLKSLNRYRPVLDSDQSAYVHVNGKRYLSFSSNNYLGLANHPKLIVAAQEATAKFGTGTGASRMLTGYHRMQKALEEELAEYLQRPNVLFFSNGYMANLGIMSSLGSKSTSFILDRYAHASLIDGAKMSDAQLLRYRHLDAEDCFEVLSRVDKPKKYIVTESIFSMSGSQAPLAKLIETAEKTDSVLIVDDAHGFGVLGYDGRGVCARPDISKRIPILIGTFGKALGSYGAFVSGSSSLIDYLTQFARSYIYTTGLPPAVIAANRAGLQLCKKESWRREKLGELISEFKKLAACRGITLKPSNTPIQTVVVRNMREGTSLASQLVSNGIYLPFIRPPTVPMQHLCLRVSLTVNHTRADIERLVDHIAEALELEETCV